MFTFESEVKPHFSTEVIVSLCRAQQVPYTSQPVVHLVQARHFSLVAGRSLKIWILSSDKILRLNSLYNWLKIDSLSFCNPMTNAKDRREVGAFFKC